MRGQRPLPVAVSVAVTVTVMPTVGVVVATPVLFFFWLVVVNFFRRFRRRGPGRGYGSLNGRSAYRIRRWLGRRRNFGSGSRRGNRGRRCGRLLGGRGRDRRRIATRAIDRRGRGGGVGDEDAFRDRWLRADVRVRLRRPFPRWTDRSLGSLSPDCTLERPTTVARGFRCRRYGSVADRLLLVSKTWNRRAGDQRPVLVKRQGDHREAERGGHSKQRQRRCAGPIQDAIAKETLPCTR